MKRNLPADKVFNLWVLLHQTRDAILKTRERELRQHGITFIECGVLFIIEAIGYRATPAEISRWLFREPHSVAALLNRMEKRGLIKKTKDLERKNLIRVSMTEKGKQAHANCMKRNSVHNIMSALSDKERQQLAKYLEKLRNGAFKENNKVNNLPFP